MKTIKVCSKWVNTHVYKLFNQYLAENYSKYELARQNQIRKKM